MSEWLIDTRLETFISCVATCFILCVWDTVSLYCHDTIVGRLKATYAGRLCSEYNRLVEGLAQRGNLPSMYSHAQSVKLSSIFKIVNIFTFYFCNFF